MSDGAKNIIKATTKQSAVYALAMNRIAVIWKSRLFENISSGIVKAVLLTRESVRRARDTLCHSSAALLVQNHLNVLDLNTDINHDWMR